MTYMDRSRYLYQCCWPTNSRPPPRVITCNPMYIYIYIYVTEPMAACAPPL